MKHCRLMRDRHESDSAGQLYLVDLDQDMSGYVRFISSWIHFSEGLSFVVDPGPRSSIARLLAVCQELSLSALDLVLLTHIHLDHAGGLADVLQAFPRAKVACSPRGVKHLVDPQALWQGSVQTLGAVADHYGQPGAVPAYVFVDPGFLSGHGVQMLTTPGHAPHHVCFVFDDVLFAGEAIATHIGLPNGKPYMRPATPPRFVLPVALESMALLESISPEPGFTAFAHHGLVPGVRSWCGLAREQLTVWVEVARQEMAKPGEDWEERVFERLLHEDSLFGGYADLDEKVRNRERGFVTNSLRGIRGYLESG